MHADAFSNRSRIAVLGFLLTGLFVSGQVLASDGCPRPQDSSQGYGPYDYTNPYHFAERLPRVEEHHFWRAIENLDSDNTRMLARNLRYTLNVFPNHHRALRSMTRLVIRTGEAQPRGLERTIDCWFYRAHVFAPQDGVVHMIQGMYHYDLGEYDEALARMKAGLELEPDNLNIIYNLGLVYAEIEDYPSAREYAERVYEADFPLDGLRRKLQAAGYWDG
ncbi:tetratricopeptide repeat protein [Aquisalimonas sp.]|uniref:tetratricopeptide repeat protein n=1 Tax=Aquisalimonas sp. TaxID=1872621 RepID=UPI0025C5BAF1|nr:tetratricopeptide repeat protein [Aquisalimonas sp.]